MNIWAQKIFKKIITTYVYSNATVDDGCSSELWEFQKVSPLGIHYSNKHFNPNSPLSSSRYTNVDFPAFFPPQNTIVVSKPSSLLFPLSPVFRSRSRSSFTSDQISRPLLLLLLLLVLLSDGGKLSILPVEESCRVTILQCSVLFVCVWMWVAKTRLHTS